MAVTRISELTPMTNPVPSDLFIINNGNETNSINYGSLSTSVILDTQAADLVFTGSVGLSGVVTVDGVVTVNGDISFLGEVGGIGITQLSDVTIVGTPSNGQVLTWNSTEGYWEAQPAGVAPNTVVDSVNGLVGNVVLDADSLDDSSTSNKFVTSGEKTAIGTAIQPGENVSTLTNDANYVASGDNISELVNDAGYLTSSTSDVQSVNGLTGTVVIDADDIDDTSTDHKFATSTQLSLAETAVQPTDSIDALGDVSITGIPEVGEVLQWDGANWVAATGITTEWEVTNSASASYSFGGVGFVGDEANPEIYVVRGQTYRFRKPQSAHPFAIQTEEGTTGTLYNDGITDNELGIGTLVWEVRMDSPDTLYYQCRSHALMVGTIHVLNTPAATFSNIANAGYGVDITGKIAVEDGIDIGFGGSINAAGSSIDFQNATISFTGASIGGLSSTIRDDIDSHLNQSTATDGQLLSWDSSANAGNGDYDWVDPTAQSSSLASTFTWDASMIPDTNATYDLGSAEYKVRHLFLSDNSIKFESGDLNVAGGNLAWQGEPILPTTIANLLTVLGVESHPDNGAAIGGGLVPGDVYYNSTESKLKSVTA